MSRVRLAVDHALMAAMGGAVLGSFADLTGAIVGATLAAAVSLITDWRAARSAARSAASK